jgi:hypothetical protein
MLRKILILSLLVSSLAQAETCPTLADMKRDMFNGWNVLGLDSGEPVSASTLKRFQHDVAQFALAGWLPSAPEGSGECYYYGVKPDVDYLGVYLAKHTLPPDQSVGHWHTTSQRDFMECRDSIASCRFKD